MMRGGAHAVVTSGYTWSLIAAGKEGQILVWKRRGGQVRARGAEGRC